MILFLTGTHEQPFDRLVRAAEAVAVATGEEVVVQRGTSRVHTPHCRVVDLLPHAELLELVAQARITITHGGPATIIEAARHGVPIVVPRSPHHAEHVDAHQLRFARRLGAGVHLVPNPEHLVEAIQQHSRYRAAEGGLSSPPEILARSVANFEGAVRGLGEPRPASIGQRIRATITLLSRRPPRRS